LIHPRGSKNPNTIILKRSTFGHIIIELIKSQNQKRSDTHIKGILNKISNCFLIRTHGTKIQWENIFQMLKAKDYQTKSNK
jgi:hypothetical protein